jgi:hypothetical protein
MRRLLPVLFASTAACDGVFNLDHVAQPSDAAIEPLVCNPTLSPGDYSTEAVVLTNYFTPALTTTQNLMYLQAANDLYYSTFSGTWSTPALVTSLADPAWASVFPRLSYDGLSIFFQRHARNTSNFDVPYQSHRTADVPEWDVPTAVEFPPVFIGGDVAYGVPSANGKRVMVAHGTGGHYHLTEVVLVAGAWTIVDTTTALYPVTIDVSDTNSQLSPDGCSLVFTRVDRNVDPNDHNVMFALRGLDGTFGPAQKLFTNPSTVDEQHVWLAPDASVIYYHLNNGTIHRATRN